MIVLARHGQTDVNRDGRLQGRSDAQLTALGRRQADRLAEVLGRERPARVISSPLRRARETAGVIAAAAGVAVEIDERLLELDYGAWEGRPLAEVRADEWKRWRSDPSFCPPEGESLEDVARRVSDACCDLTHASTTVVLVSHVSPIKAAVAWALEADVSLTWRMHLDVASITRVSGDAAAPILRSFNETGHLAGLERLSDVGRGYDNTSGASRERMRR